MSKVRLGHPTTSVERDAAIGGPLFSGDAARDRGGFELNKSGIGHIFGNLFLVRPMLRWSVSGYVYIYIYYNILYMEVEKRAASIR